VLVAERVDLRLVLGVNLVVDLLKSSVNLSLGVVDPLLQRVVVVAFDLFDQDVAQHARVQSFQGVEFGRAFAIAFFPSFLARIGVFDWRAGQAELDALLDSFSASPVRLTLSRLSG
jgi:hypothetical protein